MGGSRSKIGEERQGGGRGGGNPFQSKFGTTKDAKTFNF